MKLLTFDRLTDLDVASFGSSRPSLSIKGEYDSNLVSPDSPPACLLTHLSWPNRGPFDGDPVTMDPEP
jgi:hypothetical protein